VRQHASDRDPDLARVNHLLDSGFQVYLVGVIGTLLHQHLDNLGLLQGAGIALTILDVGRPGYALGERKQLPLLRGGCQNSGRR